MCIYLCVCVGKVYTFVYVWVVHVIMRLCVMYSNYDLWAHMVHYGPLYGSTMVHYGYGPLWVQCGPLWSPVL
jgi:hypothetical protein